jgi:hypothetical protein
VVLVVFAAWLSFLTYKVYSDDGPVVNSSPAAGASASAAPAPSIGAFSIDRIGKETIGASGSVQLQAPSAPVAIQGWAVDGKADALAASVSVLVDGTEVPMAYGVKRADVAQIKHNPALAMSGYSGTIPTKLLAKGAHTLSLKITPKAGGAAFVVGKIELVIS